MAPPLLLYLLLTALTVTVCAFAIWKGGAGERLAAIAILGVMLLQRLVQAVAPAELAPTISLVFDAIPALALLILAMRYGSPWLGGVMLFYASQFALQSFYLVTERPSDLLRISVNDLNFLGIHICLIAGTIFAWRRRRREAGAASAALAPSSTLSA